MRKILEGISLIALVLLVIDTFLALVGPLRVPEKVPTHFDMAGRADRFGDPASLQQLPVAALLIYLLLTFIAIYPSLAERSTFEAPRIPSRMEVLVTGLVTWIKAEAVWIFAVFQMALIHAARNPDAAVSLIWIWILIAALAVTILWHVIAIVRARRLPAEAPAPAPAPQVPQSYSYEEAPLSPKDETPASQPAGEAPQSYSWEEIPQSFKDKIGE